MARLMRSRIWVTAQPGRGIRPAEMLFTSAATSGAPSAGQTRLSATLPTAVMSTGPSLVRTSITTRPSRTRPSGSRNCCGSGMLERSTVVMSFSLRVTTVWGARASPCAALRPITAAIWRRVCPSSGPRGAAPRSGAAVDCQVSNPPAAMSTATSRSATAHAGRIPLCRRLLARRRPPRLLTAEQGSSARQRKAHGEGAADAALRGGDDVAAVLARELARDVQAEPGPRDLGVDALRHPGEALEQAGQVLGVHADPLVAHGEHREPLAGAHGAAHLATGRRVFDGIGEKIDDHGEQAQAGAQTPRRRRRAVEAEAVARPEHRPDP